MACHGCTAKFSFFQKENACPSCGFGYCNKCLKRKAVIPNKGRSEQHVCKKCFTELTTGRSEIRPPPDAILRRLESLETPPAPPITIYRPEEVQRAVLSEEDKIIVERLARLRAENSLPPISDADIRRRLAKLKGENFYSDTPTRGPAFQADTRSDQQKVDDLLEQYQAERAIKLSQQDATGEIEARIASLRDAGVQPNSSSYFRNLQDDTDSSDDSDHEVSRVTRKIMEELRLENTSNNENVSQVPAKKRHPRMLKGADRGTPLHASTPELSFCVICFTQATTRCIDCDGDLYCSKCFTEIHRDWSETHHKSIPYEKPRLKTGTEDEDTSPTSDGDLEY